MRVLSDAVQAFTALAVNTVRVFAGLAVLVATVVLVAAMTDPNVVGFQIFKGLVNLMRWKEILF